MKLNRLLVYVSIIPRPGDEFEQRTLFESVNFPVQPFGDLMIEAKGAVFVDRDDRIIPRPEMINRLWKYFGQDSTDNLKEKSWADVIDNIDKSLEDQTRLPLEGFWIRLTGVVTEIVGNGCIVESLDSGRSRILGIELPLVYVLAECIEFEADPLRSFPSRHR